MSFPSPDRLHEHFARALAARDVDALLDLYEPDAVQLQTDGRVLHGTEALRGVFEWLVNADLQMHGTQQAPLVAGELALTSTRYDSAPGDPGGGADAARMVTAEVSRRQPDGSWRVVIDAPAFG